MFEPFPKLTRFSHDWTITEKIDGTNAQIIVTPYQANLTLTDGGSGLGLGGDERLLPTTLAVVDKMAILAGSRTRLLTPEDDNYGFAKWVQRNATELVGLGEGRHFGEWCGLEIKRNYALAEKRFVLFNAHRWTFDSHKPSCVDVVPVLGSGYFDNPSQAFQAILADLKQDGSVYSPGFMNPEGVVMYHRPSNTLFKKTFDYDEAGKWAENQTRKEAA